MSLQITKMLLPSSKYSLKCPNAMTPIGVTVHETGNIATAMSEISYMVGNNASTSYHFAVDETRAVQGLPLNRNGFHAGDGRNGRGNARTIGVEHCYNWNGKSTTKNDSKYNPLFQKALSNEIELVAQLFIQYPAWGVPEAGKNIWRHYDQSGKNCPQRMIQEGYWNTYVGRVKARYLELKGGTVSKVENPFNVKVGDTVILNKTRALYWSNSKPFSKNDFHKYWKVKSISGNTANIYSTRDESNGGWAVLHDLEPIELDNPNNIVLSDTVHLNGRAKYWANKGKKAKKDFTAADKKKTWKIKSIQTDSTANIYNAEDEKDGGWAVLHDLSYK